MVKKIVSFIIILLAYSIIGVAFLFARQSFSNNESYEIKNAFALDRAGDIYCITDNGDIKILTAVDSTGKQLFEKELGTEQFGESFFIDSIYVEHDRNIYLTVYDYNFELGLITNASVHSFYEDGSYASKIFSEKVSLSPNAYSHIISAFTEDDNNIYFAILTDGIARIFSSPKNGSEPAAKVGEINVPVNAYGFAAISSKSVAVGSADGITIYTADGGRNIGGYSGAVFDRFWNGIGSFYAMDSASGNIYIVSEDNSIANVVNGSRIINAENGLAMADLDDIAVGITGNIMGTVRNEPLRVFAGSFSLMSEVFVSNTNLTDLINKILIYVAVAAAVILLTVLTWDFYCSILKMRLSIMLRQSLLIIMAITVMLFSLTYFVITPQVINIVSNDVMHESEVIANAFEAEIIGASNGDGAVDYSIYERLMSDYGNAQIPIEEAVEFRFQTVKRPSVALIENRGGRLRVIASSNLYPAGYPANMLVYSFNLNESVKAEGIFHALVSNEMTPRGEHQFYVRGIDLPMTANDTYILVETEANAVNDAISSVYTMLVLFLLAGGIALAAIFIIIESITANAVRRLKRSVDKIALGEYNTAINVRTGDEVEELSVSVGELAEHIIEKTTSLERLNNSYYRFVPQSFLANLGENQIERVGKSLYAKKHMAVLFLRFSFSQPLSGMEAQEIFSNINSVYEHIVPIIDANGGTAYNFLFNGLNAIFPDSTESALQTAIRIRETVAAYNEIQRSKKIRTADVRIVISEGEVLLGFIGDDRRMEPTAVSAAINESEEIEKILTDSGLYIVCTESAFSSLPKDKYRSRHIGSFVTAEGERALYDMFDSDPYTMIKLKEQFMVRFELGVSLFKKQDFTNARNVFMDIVKYAADDGVSRNYMYICERNLTAEKKQLTYTVYSD